jgi:beta-glucosidase
LTPCSDYGEVVFTMFRVTSSPAIFASLALAAAAATTLSQQAASAPDRPKIEARVAPRLKIGGLTFKDLNRNGVLDPYEDWRLPIERRVDDVLARMTMEEKAGLMFHASIQGASGPNGEVLETMGVFGGGRGGSTPEPVGIARAIRGRTNPYNVEPVVAAPARELILKRGIRWAVIRPGNEAPEVTARFVNNLQEIAEGSRLGIPMAPSDNPRSGIRRAIMGVEMAGEAAPPNARHTVSQWPGQLGLAAIGDVAVVGEYASVAAREMRAMGLRVLLCPQADVALIRITTPAIVYPFGGGFGFGGGAGRRANADSAAAGRGRDSGAGATVPTVIGNTLAYTGSANQRQLDDVLKLAASGTPTVVWVDMDRPTILTEFIDQVSGVFATFGITDDALLAVAFGKHAPTGKLPFDLPSDMPSVAAQAPDGAHDLEDPLFRFGFGLTYVK